MWLETQKSYQMNKEVKRPKKYDIVYSTHPGKIYQIDVLVYNKYLRNSYHYILTVVDVYSRYAAARPMTNYSMPTIIDNLGSIFDEMGTL